MRKLTHNLAAKISAIFLLILSELGALLSGIAVLFLFNEGAYTYETDFTFYAPWEQRLYELRYLLIVLLVLALLLFFVCLIFLLCAAGHSRGADRPQLNHQDKIPLDLYLAFFIPLAIFLPWGLIDWLYWNNILSGILAVVAETLLILSLLMTLATRLKVGNWWRNTLIFRFLRLLLRVFRSLPLFWKTLLFSLAVLFLDFICIVLIFEYTGLGLLLFVLLQLSLVCLVCMVSLQLRRLKKGGENLAAGHLDSKIDTRHLFWEFKKHGDALNSIGHGMAMAVERQMKSERLKTELITNVSHDIKTPLTSIINYVDLLSGTDEPAQKAEYLAILERQSHRLKKLTEDLVEASKASTGNIGVHRAPTDVGELIAQAAAEYTERLKSAGLEAVISAPDSGCRAMADGRLLWRILDNLLSNACKYSLPGTRIYIDTANDADQVAILVRSISRQPLNISADELMERFVRGDSSRSTEGSGLGLNIARSLAELQGGTLKLYIDGDLFKAMVSLPRA